MTEDMMHRWLDADWDLFAMGTHDAETQREMDAHLRTGCRECRRSYAAAMATMTALATTVELVEPSEGIAASLLARIEERDGGLTGREQGEALAMPRAVLHGVPSPPTRKKTAWLPWAIAAGFALLALWMGLRPEFTEDRAGSAGPQSAHGTGGSVESVEGKTRPAGESTAGGPIGSDTEFRSAPTTNEVSRGQELAGLKRQLAEAESARDGALAQAKESDRALAGAVAERGTLQGELDRALEQVKLADAARASSEAEARLATQAEERIAELTRQLGKANATIADLRGAAARDGEILAFLRGGPTRQIDLRRIDVAAGEAAAVAYIASGRGLLLVAHGLPQLPAGKCYQLWATHKSGTAVESVGLLKTDGAGTGYLYARASTDLEHVTGLAITDEPSGGSVSARGRKLLFGVLN